MIRYKEDCQDDCKKCYPVEFKKYKGFTDEQKDNETKKACCRCRQVVDRLTSDGVADMIAEGHSSMLTRWTYGD